MSQFNGEPSAVGRSIPVNGRPYQIIGVAPAAFRGVFTPLKVDAWVSLAAQPHVHPQRDLANQPWLWVFGRLQPGIETSQARGELSTLAAAWIAAGDQFARYTSIRLTPLTGLPDDARQALLAFGAVLLGAATLVLIIAAANVSTCLRCVRPDAAGRWGSAPVTFADRVPLTMSNSGASVTVDGSGADGKERMRMRVEAGIVDIDYFGTLGIRLFAGRDFTPAAVSTGSAVAIVNETFARRAWPSGSPADAVGRTYLSGDRPVTIVGVAADSKYSSSANRRPHLSIVCRAPSWDSSQALSRRGSWKATS